METVFKYEIDPGNNEVGMPIGAEILTAAFQKEQLYIWARVDPYASKEIRTFYAFSTGEGIPSTFKCDYVNTAFMDNDLVYHVFELHPKIKDGMFRI